MTNPMGRSFLSYKRERRAEAERLLAALRELGVPAWNDVDDLNHAPMESEIRNVLRDPDTASAILWLTPEVANSDMIRKVEAPLILERARTGDGFFVVPVAAGGLDYSGAAATLDRAFTLDDLQSWNLYRTPLDPIDWQEAHKIAARVLRRRVETLHGALPAGEPLRVILNTRAGFSETPAGLHLDWLHRFDQREALPGAWENHLLPTLGTVAATVQTAARGRPIVATGLAAIPAAVALGVELLQPRRLAIAWEQFTAGRVQAWSIDVPRETSGFQVDCRPADLRGRDLAVLLSVADDVEPVFRASRDGLPAFRAVLEISKAGDPPHGLETPGQAADLAYLVQREVRKALKEYPEILCVHLFLAVPLGLAMMIGQLLNNVNRVQTYELVPSDSGLRYKPAAVLHPSS